MTDNIGIRASIPPRLAQNVYIKMISSIPTSRFRRSYIASSSLLAVFLVPAAIADLGADRSSIVHSLVAVGVAAAPFLPFVLPGGFGSNRKVAACIACVFALGFGIIQAVVFKEFVETGGAEGPRGEGSPLAIIIAMTFFAVLFFCPWLLTAIRGLRSWKQMEISAADASKRSGPPTLNPASSVRASDDF